MIDLKDFEYDELIEYLTSVGEKKFRAEQIFSWLHKGVESYDEMTNLSKATREKLEKETLPRISILHQCLKVYGVCFTNPRYSH